jgi:glyoxylase-like metal-dependent hydrolase (beta-lactamase superfamily II)
VPEARWHILTIGHLSRNKFWGESDDLAYRAPVCTSTLIHSDGRTIVVDPGCPADEMARVLHQRTGLRPEAVDTVFLTHFHGDHRVGLAAFPQARWCMAASEIAAWIGQVAPESPEQGLLTCLEPVADEVAPGIALFPTPGHTPGHTALIFSSAGWQVVVAGDGVMTHDFFLARDVYFNTADRAAAVASIARIAEEADIVVPGHDNYFVNRRRAARERGGTGDG